MRRGIILSIVLMSAWCIAVSVAAESPQIWVSVVTPSAGEILRYGDKLKVDIGGLTPSEVPSLCVRLVARREALGEFPLFWCNDSSFVRLDTDAGCGIAFRWLDLTAGTGELEIPWNSCPENLPSGEYQIRVELFLTTSPVSRVLRLLATTGWISVQLVPTPPPVAKFQFQPQSGAAPLTVYFDASNSTGAIAQYRWDFGDGTEGTGASITHTYTKEGEYTVRLTVLDICSRSDSAIARITALPRAEVFPVAKFQIEPETGFAPLQVHFDASSSMGEIAEYHWDFGDGQTGTGVRTTHDYVQPGTFTVILTVVDSKGLSDSASAQIIVMPQPKIFIFVDGQDKAVVDAKVGQTIQFCLGSEPESLLSMLKSFVWDFNDGSKSFEQCPRHSFWKDGQYRVSISAFTEPGLKGQKYAAEVMVNVSPPAKAVREVLGFPDPCAGRMDALPGTTINARICITFYDEVLSLSVSETVPPGWTVDFKKEKQPQGVEILFSSEGEGAKRYTWILFPQSGAFKDGASICIYYTLTPPSLASPTSTETLKGSLKVQTKFGSVTEHEIGGLAQLTLVDRLPVPVIIAHLDPPAERIKPFDFGSPNLYIITKDQWEMAKGFLGRDVIFPGARMTEDQLLLVYRYFINGVPITQCLEQSSSPH